MSPITLAGETLFQVWSKGKDVWNARVNRQELDWTLDLSDFQAHADVEAPFMGYHLPRRKNIIGWHNVDLTGAFFTQTLNSKTALELYLSGRDAWNAWVEENPNTDINFEGINFPISHASFEKFKFPITGNVYFIRTIFSGTISFNSIDFPNEVNFSSAKFSKKTSFEDVVFSGEIAFQNTTFNSTAIFQNSTFHQNVGFRDATFESEIVFRGVTFYKWAGFRGVKFNQRASFQGSTFHQRAGFRGARFHQQADFKNTIFHQPSSFLDVHFQSETDFQNSTFRQQINFEKTKFQGSSNFQSTTFTDKISFDNSTFYQAVNFRDAFFLKKTSFQKIKFNSEARFQNASFSSEVDFKNSIFSSEASFLGTNFHNRVDFTETKFIKDVVFWDANFNKEADFKNSNFTGEIGFEDANFHGEAIFKNVKFSSETGFQGTFFHCRTVFQNSTFNHKVDFSSSIFTKKVIFQNATFHQWVVFQGSKFSNEINFKNTTFGENSSLIFSKLDLRKCKKLNFTGIKCEGVLDFSGIKTSTVLDFRDSHILRSVDFSKADINFQKTSIYDLHKSQKHIQWWLRLITRCAKNDDASAFRVLKELAKQKGDYERVLDFYAKEKRTSYSYEIAWFKLLIYCPYGFFSNYGRSILRPVITLIFTWFLFSFLYFNIAVQHNETIDQPNDYFQLAVCEILKPANRLFSLDSIAHLSQSLNISKLLKECQHNYDIFLENSRNLSSSNNFQFLSSHQDSKDGALRSLFGEDINQANQNETPQLLEHIDVPNEIHFWSRLQNMTSIILFSLLVLALRNTFKS